MATTPTRAVLEELKTRFDLDELALALNAYIDDAPNTLSTEQWDRIDESLAAIDRGDGVEVRDIDKFVNELSTQR